MGSLSLIDIGCSFDMLYGGWNCRAREGEGGYRSCVGSCLKNEDIGGRVAGPASLLPSPLSALYGYGVGGAGGGGLPWPCDVSGMDMAMAQSSKESLLCDVWLSAMARIQ